MLQDPAVKPPDFELDMLACSRSATDRRQKANANSEVLKCPRCDSLNTKFCYYNNYSLTQPRHFCKNCRRYWTKGGALRNVPVGGGCRKNKRVKQRTCIDPSSLVQLGESASSMLASINNGNCSGLLPSFPGPSSTNFSDLSSDGNMLSLAFSRLQESLRLGEQSGAVSSSPALYGMDNGSGQTRTGLLNSKCIPPSQMSSIANNYENMGYTSATMKQEDGAVIYNGSEFNAMFEAPTHMSTGSATATLASLEDQLSKFSVPVESFNGCNLAAQLRTMHHHKLARQLMSEVQGGPDRGFNGLPAFEDDTHEHMRRHSKGKPIGIDGRSLSVDWQPAEIMTENLFEPATDHHNYWSNSGWTDMHALAGSAAGSAML